jgi:hypothetical protein
MNTASAAAAFMLMFNIIEEKKKPKLNVRWWMKKFYRQRVQYGNRLMRDMTFSFRHLCPSMRPRVYFCYGN